MSIISDALKKAGKDNGHSRNLQRRKNKSIKAIPLMFFLAMIAPFVLTYWVSSSEVQNKEPHVESAQKNHVPTSAKTASNDINPTSEGNDAQGIAQVAVELTPRTPTQLVPPPALPIAPAPKQSSHNLVLSGIVYSNEEKFAIINNQVLQIGDELGNHRLVMISQESIVLLNEEEKIRLKMPQGY